MKKNTVILVVIGIMTLLGLPIFVYMNETSNLTVFSVPDGFQYDKIKITNVYTNDTKNAVFVDVISTTPEVDQDGHPLNTTSKIVSASIKDVNGKTVAIEDLSAFVPKGETTTLSFYYPLPTGNYTLTLHTNRGSNFGSPSFTVENQAWSPMEQIANLESSRIASLALDSSGYPNIAVGDRGPFLYNSSLRYAVWTGSSWNIQTVDSTKDAAIFPSLALDSRGYPHISYGDFINGVWKLAEWNGTSWNVQTVNSKRGTGGWTSLALDSRGYAHICYEDRSNHALKLVEWTGTTWSEQTVNYTRGDAEWISLALDYAGNPHISYQNSNSPLNYELKYAEWTGTSWSVEIVDSIGNAHATSSMALDSNGNPHISYYDETHHALKLAERTGTTWNIQTVDSGGKYDISSSLGLDSYNRPHISYVDDLNHDLKFAEWNGESWSIQTVHSSNIGQCTSLVLDSSDHACINYRNINSRTMVLIFQS